MMIVDKTKVGMRMYELIEEGERLLSKYSIDNSIDFKDKPACISWMYSTVNIIEVALPQNHRHRVEAVKNLPPIDYGIFPHTIAIILGVLKSVATEWSSGLIDSLEFHFIGLAFEDFLRNAAEHNEKNRIEAAAILASAVLEDTLKRLCQKHTIDTDNKTLEPLINALKARQIITKVVAERLRSYAALRNQAFHANWNEINQGALRHMIEGLEELISTHFG